MILFAAFVNPALEWDMLPSWMAYYGACKFDRYHCVLHATEDNGDYVDTARKTLRGAGWETSVVEGTFGNGMLQNLHLGALRQALSPMDVMVVADGDEIHDIEPDDYRSITRGYTYAHGMTVDRWADTLRNAQAGPCPLDEQYPHRSNIFDHIRKRDGLSAGAWMYDENRPKVLFSRAFLPINLGGSHAFTGLHPSGTYHVLSGLDIEHYRWRGSAIDRIMTRGYFPSCWIEKLMDHFGVAGDDERRIRFGKLMHQRQEAMGWFPSNAEGWFPSNAEGWLPCVKGEV